MDDLKKLAKQLAEYINGKKKTKAYDTSAVVRRIVGDTAYVHIPGGVEETPVKKTIDAKVGDTVQMRVSNSTAWLVGNSTAPPTDDTKAKEADAHADKAMTKAKKAETIAEEGLKEAKGTSNYFWHVDGSGAESGAHVTQIPKDEFLANPSGGNLLMKSNAVSIRNGIYTLADFRSIGMVLGDSTINTTYGVNSLGSYKYDNTATNMIDFTANNSKVSTKLRVADAQNSNYVELKQVNGTGTLVTDAPVEAPKATFQALDNGIFALETHQILASQAIAGGAHVYNEVTFTKAGYYPLCIAGWNAPNAVFVASRLRLKDMAVGGVTVAYDIYNPRSSSSTSNFNADILWLKVTA